MAKPSNREKILLAGMNVVHERGFGAASVRDIVQAAGVPQGSFTNHFASKEAFGLEILDLYLANSREVMRQTLRNDAEAPLKRLRGYIESYRTRFCSNGMRRGCMFGNFSAEAVDAGEAIRQRVVEIFAEVQAAIAYCLKAAVAAGDLSSDTDCEELAGFIVASLQGAILLAKAQRSVEPIERFERMLFSTMLAHESG